MTIKLRRHPAEIGQLHAALDPLEAQARAHGACAEAALRLRLCAEELLMNSVLHGCGRGTGGCLAVGLRIAADRLVLRYLDNGPDWQAPPASEVAEPGGQGLRLLAAMASRLTRRRLLGWNIVHLELPLAAPVRNGSC